LPNHQAAPLRVHDLRATPLSVLFRSGFRSGEVRSEPEHGQSNPVHGRNAAGAGQGGAAREQAGVGTQAPAVQ
ncbi:hypothetical protein, partial [Corynebacterium riegelii]|uniref:hypothetical protein n=1 Tax=Corynebacterium riegelii TaxID=156976 RepID=UPI002889FFEE